MSEQQEPGPTHTPYGQSDPYGQSPYGQQPAGQPAPYGQPSPYGQPPSYGTQPIGDRRPGTVTAAAWITMVFAAIVAALFGFTGLALVVARDQVITEMERVREFQDANIDADAAVGVLVAVMLGLVVWSVISIVLAVFVLRRSNVARILLVISSAVVALLSLITITSGVSVVLLVAAIAVIVLLFTGGAGDWFKRVGPSGGHPGDHAGGYGAQQGYPGGGYGEPYGSAPTQGAPTQGTQTHYPSGDDPYGQSPSGPDPHGQQPSADNPYGQPPAAEDPYGQQPPADGGTDYPPRDYPNR